MAEARQGWFHKLIIGLCLLFLLGQMGFSQAVFAYRQARLAGLAGEPSIATQPTPAAPPQSFVDFVAAQAPPGTGVLLVTQDTGSQAEQTYFELSDRLYPAQVWWAAPTQHQSTVDWWIQTPLDSASLQALAHRLGLKSLAFDGPEPPTGFSGEVARLSPGRTIIRVNP